MVNDQLPAGKPDLKGLLPEEIAARLEPFGAQAFRGKQLFAWLHRRLAGDFAAMTDQPQDCRQLLEDNFRLTTLRVKQEHAAPDGTVKYLFELSDGQCIETVYIPAAHRATVCVSTQVGCAFRCTFCATGQSGFTRHLTAAEIVDQVYRVQAALPEGRHVTNVVYMGMGEPLANYDNVLRSIRLLTHPLGMNLGQRHLTISTVGLVPSIERLVEEGLQVNLAISLHAPTQEGRARLVPIAKKHDLDSLMAAARLYVKRTGRKVTFEYTVVPGSNDAPEDAKALAALVRHLQCVVNVIPLNPTEGLPPGMRLHISVLREKAEAFTELLRGHHIEVALRRSRGGEVQGACGQLRRKAMEE
ncbi:MAG TPA: 23S rRNA (adenine(2503)-C(2))-methyltransferase RlmN [Armatimonadota bacterium]|jgi:23S rRNA (adenine2503-C2)-methyltransferase